MERYWEEINLFYNSDESMKNSAVSLEKGGGVVTAIGMSMSLHGLEGGSTRETTRTKE